MRVTSKIKKIANKDSFCYINLTNANGGLYESKNGEMAFGIFFDVPGSFYLGMF
jgi:hypothetical protein